MFSDWTSFIVEGFNSKEHRNILNLNQIYAVPPEYYDQAYVTSGKYQGVLFFFFFYF